MVLTKRSPEKPAPEKKREAERAMETRPAQEPPKHETADAPQEADQAKQASRLAELRGDLSKEAAHTDAETARDEEDGGVFAHERVQDLRSKHGDYIMHFFVPAARLQVAKEELGNDASFFTRGIFAFRRKLGMLPESDLQRLDNREADIVEHLVEQERQAFFAEENAQEDEPEDEARSEGDGETTEATPESADAKRIAAPDIRNVLTRGEHDAEQERHNQEAA